MGASKINTFDRSGSPRAAPIQAFQEKTPVPDQLPAVKKQGDTQRAAALRKASYLRPALDHSTQDGVGAGRQRAARALGRVEHVVRWPSPMLGIAIHGLRYGLDPNILGDDVRRVRGGVSAIRNAAHTVAALVSGKR
jgi:hypothetical protein